MPLANPRWLDIVRHRIRGFRAPYLVVLQHHDVPSRTRIAAPLTAPLSREADILARRLTLDGNDLRLRLLDLTAVPRELLAETVASASSEADSILAALDVILTGYPVGMPL